MVTQVSSPYFIACPCKSSARFVETARPKSDSAMAVHLDNPMLSLPFDKINNILETIPALVVDLSNPFSVLEHLTVVEPSSSLTYSKNLLEAQNTISNNSPGSLVLEEVILDPNSPVVIPQGEPSSSSPTQATTLEVDLSSFKLNTRRKTRNTRPPRPELKTRKSSGPSSLPPANV